LALAAQESVVNAASKVQLRLQQFPCSCLLDWQEADWIVLRQDTFVAVAAMRFEPGFNAVCPDRGQWFRENSLGAAMKYVYSPFTP
jgi:hypothetical protein